MVISPLLDVKIEERDLVRLLEEVKGLKVEKNYLYFEGENNN